MPKQLDIKDAFENAHGLPRAKWKLLRERLCALTGNSRPRDQDWLVLQRHWLKLIAEVAGRNFGVIESDRFLLMARDPEESKWILDIAEQGQAKAVASLGERIGEPIVGKIPIMIFMGGHLYGQHVRYYRMDGRRDESDGACVQHDGEIHVALQSLSGIKDVLPHELAHAHVGNLRLPTWLNEGVAQMVARRWKYDLTVEFQSYAKLFWRLRRLDRFWSGHSFHLPRVREEIDFSYMFSELLAREIRSLGEDDFRKFLASAHAKDAGEAACRSVYGFGLAVWAAKLLGEGDWGPVEEVEAVEEEPSS